MLKSPKTVKVLQDAETEFLKIGVSSMQGWRWFQEDAFAVSTDLDGQGSSYVGIFDGHTTARCSQFLAEKLGPEISKRIKESSALAEVMHASFLQMDEDYYAARENPEDPDWIIRAGGSTATAVVICKDEIVVAGCGDCRCVISQKGTAEDLTRDHKPELPEEKARIEAAGGKVMNGRIGNLNVSRGIGDYSLKVPKELPPCRRKLTAAPEIHKVDMNKDDKEFLVVASDGLWECFSSQKVVDLVAERLGQEGYDRLSSICDQLLDLCLKKHPKDDSFGTTDNVTMAIVVFK